MLIVIDGLNRLRNDDGEVNLAWLPQVFPPNVRVVVATTLPTGMELPDAAVNALDDDDVVLEGHAAEFTRNQRRVVAELRRRRWHVARADCNETTKSSIMRTYLEWHEPDHESDDETHVRLRLPHDDGPDAGQRFHRKQSTLTKPSQGPRRGALRERSQAKLDFFDAQHRALEDTPTSSLTLATFLREH